MKASLVLLLATVIPLGWVVLGTILIWRFIASHRDANTPEMSVVRILFRRLALRYSGALKIDC